jgi:hypothetical protein
VGSKVLKQKLHDIEAVLKHRDNQIKELQALLKSKDGQIAQLQRLGGTRESQPESPQNSVIVSLKEQETGVIEDAQGQMELDAKDEEFKTLLSAVSEKQREIERLHQTVERQEKEFTTKLEEKEIEISTLLNRNLDRIKDLETSLNERANELEQKLMEEKSIKKQIHANEEKLKTARLGMSEKQREIERLSKIMGYQDQEFRTKMAEKQLEIKRLSDRSDSRISELGQKLTEQKSDKEQLQAKDDQLRASVVAINEKEREIERLHQTIERQEQGFRIELDAKNIEIGEVKTTLNTLQKKLLAIHSQSFWQYLKARFQTD